MLLRRITSHVKDQNWLAVGIDFFIVVVGVFTGIQVANWNASQLERREEAAFIERLQSDFERIQGHSDRSLAFHIALTEDLRTMVRTLRSGVLRDEDIPAFERALIDGRNFQSNPDRAGSFTELMSSGRGNILRDRDLLHALVDYEDCIERFAVAQEYNKESMLLVTGVYSAAFEYDVDLRLTENDLALPDGTGSFVSYDFEALAANPEFHNAAEELMVLQNNLSSWRLRISERVADIREQIAESK